MAISKTSHDLPAWGISLVINLSILGIFHFIVFDANRDWDVNTVTSISTDLDAVDELTFTEAVSTDQIGNDGATLSMTPSLKRTTAIGKHDAPLEQRIDEILNPEIPQLSEAALLKLEGNLAAAVDIRGSSETTPGGVEGAMDRVSFEIRQSLRDRKTLVIWLFDASGSLNTRRTAIADRFDNIYQQLGRTGTTEGLFSAVVSYGQNTNLLTPTPIQDVEELGEIVRTKIEEDTSGTENVFAAAKTALEKFRTWRRFEGPWDKLMFIVTDERGDDAERYLEDVISLARRSQARIYTIGNAAIFGQQKGYVRWTYEDGFQEDLPVDQGPETAFADGIQIPFIGQGSDWRLRLMSAGYGPYALTRACAETGGIYLITAESRGYTFDRAVMRRYAPDYRPVRIQRDEIKNNAAKSSLTLVAGMTYDRNLPVPMLTFRAYNDNLLRQEIDDAQRPVAEVDYHLKRMYDALAAGEQDRDAIREARWQAAFDLAMGRLLAMRVRYFGYNQLLANMKVSPQPFSNDTNNMWQLVSSSEIATGPQMRNAAEKARTYLKRVIDEHAGTPWAMLAERELSAELGWSWQEFSQPIPGSDGQTRVSEEELPQLLLAEQERRQQMQRQREKPRVQPKL